MRSTESCLSSELGTTRLREKEDQSPIGWLTRPAGVKCVNEILSGWIYT